jgi:hypothetical protein
MTRHLGTMADCALRPDQNNLDTPLRLNRSSNPGKPADELDQVVNAFNTMRQSVDIGSAPSAEARRNRPESGAAGRASGT